jgi:hypothetical protein
MYGIKAFYVIVMLTNWHGHTEQHARPVGWMTEHQCHLKARRIEMQRPHTEARCEIEHRHH